MRGHRSTQPVPSLDVLAAQVRGCLALDAFAQGCEALDALVARVTEAEHSAAVYAEVAGHRQSRIRSLEAALADARNALERAHPFFDQWHPIRAEIGEVLARLDGSQP